jgi:hypothetical protein
MADHQNLSPRARIDPLDRSQGDGRSLEFVAPAGNHGPGPFVAKNEWMADEGSVDQAVLGGTPPRIGVTCAATRNCRAEFVHVPEGQVKLDAGRLPGAGTSAAVIKECSTDAEDAVTVLLVVDRQTRRDRFAS